MGEKTGYLQFQENAKLALPIARTLAFILAKRTPGVCGVSVGPVSEAESQDDHVCLHLTDRYLQLVVCCGKDLGIQQDLEIEVYTHGPPSPQELFQDLNRLLDAYPYLQKRGVKFLSPCPTHQPPDEKELFGELMEVMTTNTPELTVSAAPSNELMGGAHHKKHRQTKLGSTSAVWSEYKLSPEVLSLMGEEKEDDEFRDPEAMDYRSERLTTPLVARYSPKFLGKEFTEKELTRLYSMLLGLEAGMLGAPCFEIKNYAWQLNGLTKRRQLEDWWILPLIKLISLGLVEKVESNIILVHRVRVNGKRSTACVAPTEKTKEVKTIMPVTSPKFPELFYFSTQRELECYRAILEIVNPSTGDDWRTISAVGLFTDLQTLARKRGLKADYYAYGFISLKKHGVLEEDGREGKARKVIVHQLSYSSEIKPRKRDYRRRAPAPEAPTAGPVRPTIRMADDATPPATISELNTLLSQLAGHGDLLERLADAVLRGLGANKVTFERLGNSTRIDYTRC